MLAEMAMLLVVEGASPGMRILIDQPKLTIGRQEDCGLVIPDRQVSRRHACIRQDGDLYVLEDLDSKNGTFVNGQELRGTHVLQDGDEIQIALCCKLAFVAAEATAPISSRTVLKTSRMPNIGLRPARSPSMRDLAIHSVMPLTIRPPPR